MERPWIKIIGKDILGREKCITRCKQMHVAATGTGRFDFMAFRVVIDGREYGTWRNFDAYQNDDWLDGVAEAYEYIEECMRIHKAFFKTLDLSEER